MKIDITRPNHDELEIRGVYDWPIWEKGVSEFDWHYDSREQCFIIEGEFSVATEFETVQVKKGDFVTFPKGLSCTWKITKAVKKHYSFD